MATRIRRIAKPKPAIQWAWLFGGLITVLAILAAFALWQKSPAALDSPPVIDVHEAAEKRAAGAVMLDVRQPEEWEEAHIPGALLIPLGELPSRLDEVPEGQEVVVYCRSGNRSQEGRDILRRAGFEQVTSMAGGIGAWLAAGLPAARGR